MVAVPSVIDDWVMMRVTQFVIVAKLPIVEPEIDKHWGGNRRSRVRNGHFSFGYYDFLCPSLDVVDNSFGKLFGFVSMLYFKISNWLSYFKRHKRHLAWQNNAISTKGKLLIMQEIWTPMYKIYTVDPSFHAYNKIIF